MTHEEWRTAEIAAVGYGCRPWVVLDWYFQTHTNYTVATFHASLKEWRATI